MRLSFRLFLVCCGFVFLSASTQFVFANEVPSPWTVKGIMTDKYDAGVDPTVIRDGKASAYIKSKEDKIDGFATIRQKFASKKYIGKRVKFSAWLKTEDVKDAAMLWMRVDGREKNVIAFDNMDDRPVRGTSDWKQYSCVLDVAPESDAILFGVWLSDSGKVWANGLEFQVVSRDVPTTDKLNKDEKLSEEPSNLDFSEKK